MDKNKKSFPCWLWLIVIISILFGIFFRLYNINNKIVAYDEPATLLRLAGYTDEEFNDAINNSKIIKLQELDKFTSLNNETNIKKVITSLAKDEPHMLPGYYALIYIWAKIFGDSIKSIRLFSSLLSILSMMFLFFLSRELFNSSKIAWLTAAIVSVSPLHIVFTQEARPYSLLILSIVASSTFLIKALKKDENFLWIFYFITLTLGIYTHLFFVFVLFAHILYVLLFYHNNYRISMRIKKYFLCLLSSLIIFLPWTIIIILNYSNAMHATAWARTFGEENLPRRWLFHITVLFCDFFYGNAFSSKIYIPNIRFGLFVYPFIILIISYSIYFLIKNSSKKTTLFLLALIISNFSLIFVDLYTGGYMSNETRYFIPGLVVLQLIVTYLLGKKIEFPARSIKKITWLAIFIFLILFGVLSGFVNAQSKTWWSKHFSSIDEVHISKIINEKEKPFILVNSLNKGLRLSRQITTNAYIQEFGNLSEIIKNDSDYTKIFLILAQDNSKYKNELNKMFTLIYLGKKTNLYILNNQTINNQIKQEIEKESVIIIKNE